ncbi:MAG: Tim44 domain-containing protein [Rhodospirillaceae bacterium]|nr:Tim44 domain-containing protein [Rhodospirillaceae bacterium]
MNDGIQFFDIILLAMIAGFVILRLRSVLGRRTGNERPPKDPFARRERRAEDVDDKVVELPDRRTAAEPGATAEDAVEAAPNTGETSLEAGIAQIQAADRNFDPDQFANGARAAFEMIVESFARGDVAALRGLLSNEVLEGFKTAIAEREAAGRTLETTVVGIKSAELIEAYMNGRTAFATVTFVSEQINVTRDSEDNVVEGDDNRVTDVTDIWTFARNTRSRDPNWTLVETRSPN